MKYCKSCVYPFVTVNLNIAEDSICSSCKSFEKSETFSPKYWNDRKNKNLPSSYLLSFLSSLYKKTKK